MDPGPVSLTDDIFTASMKCQYKAYLKLRGSIGVVSDYERLQARLAEEYRHAAWQMILRTHPLDMAVRSPPSLLAAIQSGATLILNAAIGHCDTSCRLDMVMRSEPRRASAGDH